MCPPPVVDIDIIDIAFPSLKSNKELLSKEYKWEKNIPSRLKLILCINSGFEVWLLVVVCHGSLELMVMKAVMWLCVGRWCRYCRVVVVVVVMR